MTVAIVGETIPSVPESFQLQLSTFDPDLYVVWNKSPYSKKPGRWQIERCIQHNGGYDLSGRPQHSHVCVRTYILSLQDDDGTPVPLGEWVFNKLREMRARWEALGGDTERGVRNALAESNRIEQDLQTKHEAATLDMIDYNQKDKRMQINKLWNLIERHDMRPNR